MISFKDIFKSSFLENVNAVTLPDMAIALVLAFLVGLFIFFVYKKTYSGVLYSSSFGVTLVALTMITTLVILAVTSNVVLSLGMVGALSIVRFRTASQRASRCRAGRIRMRMPLRTSPRATDTRNAASIWLNRNRGNTNFTGRRYRRASTSSPSSAPKRSEWALPAREALPRPAAQDPGTPVRKR